MAQSRGNTSWFIKLLTFVLVALALLLIIFSALYGASGFILTDGSPGRTLVDGVATLAVGVTIAVALLALAGILHLLEQRLRQTQDQQHIMENLQSAVVQLEKTIHGMPPASAAATTAARQPSTDLPDAGRSEILTMLEQIRDLSSMNELQRQEWTKRHWARRKELLIGAIERSLGMGNWTHVQTQLEELRASLPGDPDVEQLAKRVDAEHTARLEGDVAAARNQVRHLMSISGWDQAEEVVAAMQRKYPEALDVQHLSSEIQREREAFERENTERLFMDLNNAIDHRQWRRAVQVAEEFVQRYPLDARVDKLQQNLITMKENAASQERKEHESLFKDLLKRQRYQEALDVAKSVIEKHPTSAASAELLKLIPKVEELVRQEQAKRQQTPAANG